MMDKDEIIILSSDDDESNDHQFEKYKPYVTIKPISKKTDKNFKSCLVERISQKALKRKFSGGQCNTEDGITVKKVKVPTVKCKNLSKESPEIVDLVDCLEKSPNELKTDQSECGENGEPNDVQRKTKLDVIDIDGGEDEQKCGAGEPERHTGTVESEETLTVKTEVTSEVKSNNNNNNNGNNDNNDNDNEPEEMSEKAMGEICESSKVEEVTNDGSDQNLKSFTEFVELCGSLEKIPKDRIRLTKKLMKRYGEANSDYIKSEEFSVLIEKCKGKVNENNLYLIAKDITSELSFRKKINMTPLKSSAGNENSQRNCESAKNVEPVQEKDKQKRKRIKFINKILKKLDKLGEKIRELEEEEVDLSDEEGSAYVQLQRYRDRFCLIYRKLCKYTNEIPDADRIYNEKICFTESKYPEINKCIEVFLNKTKRFPDFTDIMKLLESQSSSLGLPSNRESLRMTAIEIFQQVGAMLQRKRKYDLWDSYCGFLDDHVDPARDDPVLEKILKDNYESRLKKEQDIFQHYSELQEKERLEPEEIPEEEANRSPVESGNEDEKEIEEIENDINKRLDAAITEDTKDNGNRSNDWSENKMDSTNQTEQKESKNNYKNCKSLKWRSENSGKSKDEGGNSEESSTEPENDVKETEKPDTENGSESKEGGGNSNGETKNDSDAGSISAETEKPVDSEKDGEKKEEKGTKYKTNGFDYFQLDEENEDVGKSDDSFDVRYCHVFARNAFENLSGGGKKPWEKRKVFRDLTNVNRLMELHGKRSRRMCGSFAPPFFYGSFGELEKLSWKRKFRMSFRVGGGFREEKCGLGEEERTGKGVGSDAGGESDERDVRDSSEGGGEEREGFFSGHGGESHEDGDEDRNRKNGRTGDDVSENKPEEEEEDEEKDENETESEEHSEKTEKTDESQETQPETEWPSDVLKITNTNTNTTENKQVLSDNHGKEDEQKNREPETEGGVLENKEKRKCGKSESFIRKGKLKVRHERETVIQKIGKYKIVKEDESEILETKINEIAEKESEIIEKDNEREVEKEVIAVIEHEEDKIIEEEEEGGSEITETEDEILDEEENPVEEEEEESTIEKVEIESLKTECKEIVEKENPEKMEIDTNEALKGDKNDAKEKEESELSERREKNLEKLERNENEVQKEENIVLETEKENILEKIESEFIETEKSEIIDTNENKMNEKVQKEKSGALETVEKNTIEKEINENEKSEIISNEVQKYESKNLEKLETEIEEKEKEGSEIKNSEKISDKDGIEIVENCIEKNASIDSEIEKTVESDELDIISSVVSKWPSKRLSEEMSGPETQFQVSIVKKENGNIGKRGQNVARAGTNRKSFHLEQKAQKKSASDEEIVKRFLMHSPSSISITPPRKLSLPKPPSQAAMQALATLRNLKGISATIVRGKPKTEDRKGVPSSNKRYSNQKHLSSPPKRGRSELPVISNVQSIYYSTPKIVTVEGNVSGFDTSSQGVTNTDKGECNSSSIKISNVWGSLPNTFMQSAAQDHVTPGCSSDDYQQTGFIYQQSNYQPWKMAKKKNTKKKVEYVVLD